ncbi:MAG: SAM-dependent methyltransferase [Chloroflexi bacterium]|nr:SAM-dependent methyltransferase [Chloroflexota bacterium]
MANLEDRIKGIIRRQGPITFARFMELALFDPGEGYYTSVPEPVGGQGDYYTSPTAHPIFAALIGLQLEQMWHILGRPTPFYVVESGAGKGLLARDILAYLPRLSPDMMRSVCYVALDRRAGVQNAPGLQRLIAATVPLRQVVGCFLCNELMDALPTHRVMQRGGQLMELYVGLEAGKFADVVAEPSTPRLQQHMEAEGVSLAEGCISEVNLEATRWLEAAAHSLGRGFLTIIDYGYLARERLSPEWSRGSITTYYQHTMADDPYVRVGRQDITSHVDFTSLVMAGDRSGLSCLGLTSQRQFLHNLGLDQFVRALSGCALSYQHYLANRMAMQDLARPDGPGGFKVLIQSKGMAAPSLWGLRPGSEARARLAALGQGLPVPLLDEAHISLMAAKYPQYFMVSDEDELPGRR